MNKPVNFELAKLLKEKGFDENCRYGYNGSFEPHHTGLIEFGYLQTNSELLELTYLAPTIADVVMWLYEKHGIWIKVDMVLNNKWFYNIKKIEPLGYNNLYGSHLLPKQPTSPTEAYEAAIKYCLTELI